MDELLSKEGFQYKKNLFKIPKQAINLSSPSELMKIYKPNYLVILLLAGVINILILAPFIFTARETKYKNQNNNQTPVGGKSY
jgi:hypothetical protein